MYKNSRQHAYTNHINTAGTVKVPPCEYHTVKENILDLYLFHFSVINKVKLKNVNLFLNKVPCKRLEVLLKLREMYEPFCQLGLHQTRNKQGRA